MNTGMVIGMFVGITGIMGLCFWGGWENCRIRMEKQAVASGNAHFDPLTSEFKWGKYNALDENKTDEAPE